MNTLKASDSFRTYRNKKLSLGQAVETRVVVRRRGSHIFYTISRPLYPGRFLVLISVRGWVDPEGHSAAGRIRSIEKSNDFIGNRARELPVCSMVPQPTTLPRSPLIVIWTSIRIQRSFYHEATQCPQLYSEDGGRKFHRNVYTVTYILKYTSRLIIPQC
jgi:hypothetical protein